VRAPAQAVIEELRPQLELIVVDVAAATVCRQALGVSWTRDPFDRLLAAQATIGNLTLVTKDDTIRRHFPLAWWAE